MKLRQCTVNIISVKSLFRVVSHVRLRGEANRLVVNMNYGGYFGRLGYKSRRDKKAARVTVIEI